MDYRAVVVSWPAGAARSGRCLQTALAHKAAHPFPGGAHARMTQPRPDLAVALAVKRTVGEHPPMLSRETAGAEPAAVFTDAERHLLEQATPERKRQTSRDLAFHVRAVARLGGCLDRASDAPPGTTVIWRGFSRLADLVEGARIATPQETYG